MDDDRFKHIFTDPIFKPTSKSNKKIIIGKRFKSVLKDKRFNSFSKYDSRGKPVRPEDMDNLTKYYQIEDSVSQSSIETKSDDQAVITSEEEHSSNLSAEESVNKVTEATKRLALCGVDWDIINAQVCMNMFQSFLPRNKLQKVQIFKSDFGIKKEEEDNKQGIGPPNSKEAKTRLRKYERERLFYFYAVLDFDSEESAKKVYEECDGKEMELSGFLIDLRFISEQEEFDRPPVDSCDSSEAKLTEYKFVGPSKSTIQTKEVPVWDRDHVWRGNLMMKAFDVLDSVNTEDQDFSALIGTRSDDSADEANVKRERELLLGESVSEYKNKFNEQREMDFSWHFSSDESDRNAVPSEEEVKVKEKKRKKKKTVEKGMEVEDVLKLKDGIVADSRFKSLFSDPKFNIDISSHEFKSSQLNDVLRDEIISAQAKQCGAVVCEDVESVQTIANKIKKKMTKKAKNI